MSKRSLQWDADAWEDYLEWQQNNKAISKKDQRTNHRYAASSF